CSGSNSVSKAKNLVSLKKVLTNSFFAGFEKIKIPALMNSSRSTFGKIRMTAYSYKIFSCILCFFYKYFRVFQSQFHKVKIDFSDYFRCQIRVEIQPFIR